MKNVTGGIGPNQVWIICDDNGVLKREISNCDPCAHCNGDAEGFVSFADGYSCPSCNL